MAVGLMYYLIGRASEEHRQRIDEVNWHVSNGCSGCRSGIVIPARKNFIYLLLVTKNELAQDIISPAKMTVWLDVCLQETRA